MVTPLRENSSMISGEMEEETERCVEVDCTKTLLSRGVDILSVTEVIDEGDECRKINLNVRGSDAGETESEISESELSVDLDHSEFEDLNDDIGSSAIDDIPGNLDVQRTKTISSPDIDINPQIRLNKSHITYDPASLVGVKLSEDEKSFLLHLDPCQPSEKVLKQRYKKQGDRIRHCSHGVFYHDAGRIKKHEQSAVHQEANIAQVLFQSSLNIEPLLEKQQEACEDKRKRNVIRNREIVERIIDVIFLLGKQGSSIRGHNEKLSLEAAVNNGNFLETLKLLAKYDSKIHEHLLKVESEQSKCRGEKGPRGRGSKITFLSNKTQEKLIRIIGEQITDIITQKIKECQAWSLIVDSTPDIVHKEQLSICVRIVASDGSATEHLLGCKNTVSTTAKSLFEIIRKALESTFY